MSETTIDPAMFRQVLGSYPTGVCAVTSLGPEQSPLVMVVGTFTSVSLDPPLVGFLPAKNSSTWPLIEATGQFCVNVLGSDQRDACFQMASKGPDRLAGIGHETTGDGRLLLNDALTRIECSIHAVVEAGDHWFVLGQVRKLEMLRTGDPLLFHLGRYGGFAEFA
jgi:3-hydroxy-9,10-secoandrosta-1,3,5(10)-triene-9,17-dione monooxygenase reductase component